MLRILFLFVFLQFSLSCLNAQGKSEGSIVGNKESKDSLLEQALIASNICADYSLKSKEGVIQKCKEAVASSKKAGSDSLTVVNLGILSTRLHWVQGSDQSKPYLMEAVEIAEDSKNKYLLMPAYYIYATLYERHIDLESALEHLNIALAIAKETNDIAHQIKILSGIGYLLSEANFYEEAQKYYIEGLEIASENNVKPDIATSQGYLAMTYLELGNYDLARSYYLKAKEYFITKEDSLSIVVIDFGLAKLESLQKNYKKSNEILEAKTLTMSSNLGSLKYSNELLASNYFNLGNYQKSLDIYKGIEVSLNKLNDNILSNKITKNIAACYLALGDYENAALYYKQVAQATNTNLNNEVKKAITSTELKHELTNKESENKILAAEKEKLELTTSLRAQKLIGSIALLCFISGGLGFFYRHQRKKTKLIKAISVEQGKINKTLLHKGKEKDIINQELVSRNNELSSFASIVAHDLKSPIRTNSSFIQLLKRHIQQDEKVTKYLNFIEGTNKRLDHLVNDLLAYASSGEYKNEQSAIDLNKILITVKHNLNLQIAKSDAIIDVRKLPVLLSHETAMIQVFQNIISNSIKFTAEGKTPKVEISATKNSDFISIIFKDNGIGIAEKYIDRIFNPLTRLNSNDKYEGSGLGLATCKKIVEYYLGNLEVFSTPEIGSTFKVNLPISMLLLERESNNLSQFNKETHL